MMVILVLRAAPHVQQEDDKAWGEREACLLKSGGDGTQHHQVGGG